VALSKSDRVVILGGGVAGLAASLASGAPVYEAGDEAGGAARSRRVGGFTFDHGIHILQTEQPAILDMLRELGISLCTRQRQAMIYSHGTYTAYPFQVNTAGLPLRLRARCLWKYFRRDRDGEPANYLEWIYQNLGEGYGDTFLVPYSEKFWMIHPREMTHEWTGNRIPSTGPWQMLRGAVISRQTNCGTNVVFRYPDHGDGFSTIPRQMSKAASEIHLNHRATRIDTLRRSVEFNDGEVEVPYDTLITTIPLPALVRLIPEAPDEVRSAASRLRHNSIAVVNLGIDSPWLSDSHWVHFPEKDIAFFRISYPHNLGPGMAPAGMTSVAAEVAYAPDQPLDRTTLVDRVIDDLIRVSAIRPRDRARIVVRDIIDIRCAYVIYDHERRAAVRTIRNWLQERDIEATGRYGLWAYLWSHEAIQAGRQAGLRVAGAASVA
jgi:protoporphyrinogen oxidase